MSDADFVLSLLETGPATTMQMIRISIDRRGCGLTPHSRVSDLRRAGHNITCRRIRNFRGRPIYQYTLVQQPVQLELTG